MPARGDLDPADLPELLPYVALIEIRWEPRCFLCSLVAYWHTSHQRALGYDTTGFFYIPAKP